MSKRKYCHEFTEYRQYKCCECGRTMHEPTSHYCNGQYRKRNLKFVKMKPFNLKEYLKDPSKEVITRDGRTAKIHCTNYCSPNFPIIAEIEGWNCSKIFTEDGHYNGDKRESPNDLFFAPKKCEGG